MNFDAIADPDIRKLRRSFRASKLRWRWCQLNAELFAPWSELGAMREARIRHIQAKLVRSIAAIDPFWEGSEMAKCPTFARIVSGGRKVVAA